MSKILIKGLTLLRKCKLSSLRQIPLVPSHRISSDFSIKLHGIPYVDEYHHLQRYPHPETQSAVANENSYSQQFFRRLSRLERRVYRDILNQQQRNITEGTASSNKIGDTYQRESIDEYDYYVIEEGQHYQRQHRPSGRIETVLNCHDAFFEKRNFYSIGMMKISPDHRLVAFTMSTDGSEQYTLHIHDISSQIYRERVVYSHVVSIEWGIDSDILYFTAPDDKWRPFRLYRWILSTGTQELLFEEQDDRFFLDIHKTKDKKYLTINCNSKSTSEVQLLCLDSKTSNTFMFHRRQDGVEYYVDHRHDGFYAITNADGAYNYKLVHIADSSNRETLLYQCLEENEKIEDMELFNDSILLYQKQGGVPFLRLSPRGRSPSREFWIKISLPNIDNVDRTPCSLTPFNNSQIDTSRILINYSSPLISEQTLELCLATGEMNVVRREERSLIHTYECCTMWVSGENGIRIPLTLIHKKHLVRTGNHPVLMRVYGAYGHDLDLGFDGIQTLLLEHGWIICYAHVRGGGEMGRSWHLNATKDKKMNSINDLITCGRWLVDQGYTNPHNLSIRGLSAGGLVCASAAIIAPDLFRGPILLVAPFVDIVNTMIDRDLPLTVHEIEEWGDPLLESDIFKAMLDYSPYELLKKTPNLPPLYCTTSLCDIRVPYWQPLKFIARYRHLNSSASQTSFLTVASHGSHFGTGGTDGPYYDAAREYTFLWHFSSQRK